MILPARRTTALISIGAAAITATLVGGIVFGPIVVACGESEDLGQCLRVQLFDETAAPRSDAVALGDTTLRAPIPLFEQDDAAPQAPGDAAAATALPRMPLPSQREPGTSALPTLDAGDADLPAAPPDVAEPLSRAQPSAGTPEQQAAAMPQSAPVRVTPATRGERTVAARPSETERGAEGLDPRPSETTDAGAPGAATRAAQPPEPDIDTVTPIAPADDRAAVRSQAAPEASLRSRADAPDTRTALQSAPPDVDDPLATPERDTPSGPTLDLVRVEPDGAAIIAGNASPGATVEIFADDALIGTETGDAAGDWVFVSPSPLPTGGVDLRVRDTQTGRLATTAVAVVVAQDRTSEPLVVASEDGTASDILQGMPLPTLPARGALEQGRNASAPASRTAPETLSAQEPGTVAQDSGDGGDAEALTPLVPPTIDAIEVEGERNFFAGAGAEGRTVRLYVENSYVGDTRVRGGRWLVESEDVLEPPRDRVRADMLDDEGDVLARAQIDFVLDQADASGVQDPEAQAIAPRRVAAQEGEPGADIAAPTASTPETGSRALATSDPARAPGVARADTPEPIATPSIVEMEPIEESANITRLGEETAVPVLLGEREGDRIVSGRAIIRRGDNLWTIARRVYGAGVRYTQIYEANATQIVDPALIYPGQVFDLPQSDAVIGGADGREGAAP